MYVGAQLAITVGVIAAAAPNPVVVRATEPAAKSSTTPAATPATNASANAAATAAIPPAAQSTAPLDSDHDGLSDFDELHKYLTDPKKADSDGDGLADGDWNERREFAYSVHAVMDVMAPFDVASMNDDYQDVRVLEVRPDLLEFEAVVYPLNTVADAIQPNANWRKPPAEQKEFLRAGPCCNWDAEMQKQLVSELARDSIDVAKLDDVAVVQRVSKWLLERAQYEDSFTTFAVEFDHGKPRVTERQVANVEETLKRFGRTLEQQWDRELLGKGMFETKTRGSCTSSAIYLSTALKAIGIPTRTIVCVPIVDANDEREVEWLHTRVTHVGVRQKVTKAVDEMRGKWASHTFNEVWVGGRWRRLNYTKLGQNVLDDNYLGLMVHVHTYADHGDAGLVGWGNREVHPLHAALFGGPNPYSCVSLSDLFGAHTKATNDALTRLRELTIGRLYWYDDPKKDPALTTELGELGTAGYLFAHIDSEPDGGGDACMEFWHAVGRDFVLRARDRDDVRAVAIEKYWINSGKELNDFILRIAPADFARMEPGTDYQLVWPAKEEDLHWKIRDGVTIARPKR